MKESEKLLIRLYNSRHTNEVINLEADCIIHNETTNKALEQLALDGFIDTIDLVVSGAEFTYTTVNIGNRKIRIDLTQAGMTQVINLKNKNIAIVSLFIAVLAFVVSIISILNS